MRGEKQKRLKERPSHRLRSGMRRTKCSGRPAWAKEGQRLGRQLTTMTRKRRGKAGQQRRHDTDIEKKAIRRNVLGGLLPWSGGSEIGGGLAPSASACPLLSASPSAVRRGLKEQRLRDSQRRFLLFCAFYGAVSADLEEQKDRCVCKCTQAQHDFDSSWHPDTNPLSQIKRHWEELYHALMTWVAGARDSGRRDGHRLPPRIVAISSL